MRRLAAGPGDATVGNAVQHSGLERGLLRDPKVGRELRDEALSLLRVSTAPVLLGRTELDSTDRRSRVSARLLCFRIGLEVGGLTGVDTWNPVGVDGGGPISLAPL